MSHTRIVLRLLLVVLLLGSASCGAVQTGLEKPAKGNVAGLPEEIWRDPGDLSSLNLLYGIGGKEHAPDPTGQYAFVKEDLAGTSPKFYVQDAQGVEWKVKLGPEVQSEVAAARLLTAAGYFVDEDYFLPQFNVSGLPRLHRGQNFVSADGTVNRARLKRHQKGAEKGGTWDWFDNPFLGTKELNGLRVMMALMNNWDLKAMNNAIYDKDGARCYLVSDLGATFGKTGSYFTRSKCVLKDYERSHFIKSATPTDVDFVMHSRPSILAIFAYNVYRERTRIERITRDIPRADAKWLGERLSLLSEDQIRDCFRAAGYTPAEVEGYTRTVQKRIADLEAL